MCHSKDRGWSVQVIASFIFVLMIAAGPLLVICAWTQVFPCGYTFLRRRALFVDFCIGGVLLCASFGPHKAMVILIAILWGATLVQWTPGPLMVIAGTLGNSIAMLSNGGLMPAIGLVSPTDRSHTTIIATTHLLWLCDIIHGEIGPLTAWYSVGDAFIGAGLTWMLCMVIRIAR